MKYPVQWSLASKVKLVFFIAINFENSQEVVELFKFLYSLIDNKKAIEKIISAKESKDIYEILMEEIR